MGNTTKLPNDIHVLSFLKTDSAHSFVQLSFDIPHQRNCPSVVIPMSAVNTGEILNHIPEGYVVKLSSSRDQAAYMRRIISEAQENVDIPHYDMLMPGYNQLPNGRLLYVLGDMILGEKSKEPYFPFNPDGLTVNRRLICTAPSEHIFDWTYKWAKQSSALSALLLVALSPFVLPIITELCPQAEALNAFVVGRTGCGKTSFSSIVTDLFRNEEHSFSLLAPTKEFYNLVQNRSNIPVLIDDLSSSASSNHNAKLIERCTKLIMSKSASGCCDTGVSSEHLKNLSLIFTAEETLQSPSSMNRTVICKMPDQFNGEDLTYLQDQNFFPVLAARLVDRVCKQRNEILPRVAKSIRDLKTTPPYEDLICSGSSRIHMSYKAMLIVKLVLVDYLRYGMKCDEKRLSKLEKHLDEGICNAIRNTKEASRKCDDDTVLSIFLNLFKADMDHIIARNPDEYFDAKTGEKVFFYYEGHFYFRGDILHAYMEHHFMKVSLKKLSDVLNSAGLLRTRGKENSYPLPKKLKKLYKQEGIRYYRVYANVLEPMVAERCSNIIELFGSSLNKYM